jgi:hypothetical protein
MRSRLKPIEFVHNKEYPELTDSHLGGMKRRRLEMCSKPCRSWKRSKGGAEGGEAEIEADWGGGRLTSGAAANFLFLLVFPTICILLEHITSCLSLSALHYYLHWPAHSAVLFIRLFVGHECEA